jgi:hypothetical protein
VYYLLRNMSAVNNHVGLCEAWILLQAYILRFAHMSSLELDDINQTFSLIEQSIDFEVGLLKEEVYSKSGNFVEGTPIGDGGLMYSIRLTIVFGWLAAQECIQSTFIPNHVIDTHLLSLIDDNFAYLGVWSEYAIPFMAFICLAKYKAGHQKNAESLLATLLRTIVVLNNERRKSGFPNPYYTPDDLISSLYSMQGKEIDFTQFAGSSYTFRSLVDGLVYLNRRDLLEPMWKQIIETRSVEYYPSDPWDLLLWRSDQGQERDFGYEFPTSWNKLMSELPDSFELPIPLFSNPKFMTYFSLVYPHRFRRDLFMAILKTYIESSTP